MVRQQIGAVRPVTRAARLAIDTPGPVQAPAIRIFRLQGGAMRERVFEKPRDRQPHARKRTRILGRSPVQPRHHRPPAGRDRDSFGRHALLERAQPGTVYRAAEPHPIAQQARSFAQRVLESGDAPGVVGVEPGHDPVKKPPALRRRFGKDPIHIRGQP